MARDILGEFSNNSLPAKSSGGNSRVGPGGKPMERDVMNYSAPVIPGWDPKGSMGPGLGGANLGNCGTQGPKGSTGDGAGGSPGVKRSGGEGRGMGTNRG